MGEARLQGLETPLPAFLLSTPSRQKPSRDVLPLKRKREHYPTQRSWSYLADMDHEAYATAATHTSPSKARAKAKARANLVKRVNPCTLYGREKVKARENQHSKAREPPHYRNNPFPVSRSAQQTTPALLTIQVR